MANELLFHNNAAKKYATYYFQNLRSHPFYFIGLPFYLVLITAFYWLIFVPLLYVKIVLGFGASDAVEWSVWFFIAALTGYLATLLVFFYIWRCKRSSGKENIFVVPIDPSRPVIVGYDVYEDGKTDNKLNHFQEEEQDKVPMRKAQSVRLRFEDGKEKSFVVPIDPSRPVIVDYDVYEDGKTDKKLNHFQEEEQDEVPVRKARPTSLRFEDEKNSTRLNRDRPKTFQMGEMSPASQNLSTPLTPRELFFRDLIEQSNEHFRNSTVEFIEKERESFGFDSISPGENGRRAEDFMLVEKE